MAARGRILPTLSHRQALLSLGLLGDFPVFSGKMEARTFAPFLNRSVCVLLLGCRSSFHTLGGPKHAAPAQRAVCYDASAPA